jgi:two-component system, LytTR family, response regulator
MTPARTLIVEDQPVAREWLTRLVDRRSELSLAGSCGDGLEAVRAIEALRPDLVFLDLQLPELDGFGVIEAVGVDRMPPVIFVTAFDTHAIRAFELHALDYLLKPFTEERFDRAVGHAHRYLQQVKDGELAQKLIAAARALDRPAAEPKRLLVRDGGRVRFVDTAAIEWIEADGNYVRLHSAGGDDVVRQSISAIEERLRSAGFARIHRGAIVNLAFVVEMQATADGEYDAVLQSGMRLRVGRSYRDEFRARLTQG